MTRVDLAPVLKDAGRGVARSGWSLSKVLVIGQLALSVPLLIAAGLFVRSLVNLETLDVGYDRDNLVVLKADMTASGYTAPAQQLERSRALIDRLKAVPGVRAVTMSENGLFSGADSNTTGLIIEGFESRSDEDRSASFNQIGPKNIQGPRHPRPGRTRVRRARPGRRSPSP